MIKLKKILTFFEIDINFQFQLREYALNEMLMSNL